MLVSVVVEIIVDVVACPLSPPLPPPPLPSILHLHSGHIALDLMGLVLLLVRPRHLDSGIQTIKDSQLTDNKQ